MQATSEGRNADDDGKAASIHSKLDARAYTTLDDIIEDVGRASFRILTEARQRDQLGNRASGTLTLPNQEDLRATLSTFRQNLARIIEGQKARLRKLAGVSGGGANSQEVTEAVVAKRKEGNVPARQLNERRRSPAIKGGVAEEQGQDRASGGQAKKGGGSPEVKEVIEVMERMGMGEGHGRDKAPVRQMKMDDAESPVLMIHGPQNKVSFSSPATRSVPVSGHASSINPMAASNPSGPVSGHTPSVDSIAASIPSPVPTYDPANLPSWMTLGGGVEAPDAGRDQDRAPVLGELSAPPAALPELEPRSFPKRLTTRGPVVSWRKPRPTNVPLSGPQGYLRQGYNDEPQPTGKWQGCYGTPPSPKSNNYALMMAAWAGADIETIPAEEINREWRMRQALATFAPSRDDSNCSIPTAIRSQVWYHRRQEAEELERRAGPNPLTGSMNEGKSEVPVFDPALIDPALLDLPSMEEAVLNYKPDGFPADLDITNCKNITYLGSLIPGVDGLQLPGAEAEKATDQLAREMKDDRAASQHAQEKGAEEAQVHQAQDVAAKEAKSQQPLDEKEVHQKLQEISDLLKTLNCFQQIRHYHLGSGRPNSGSQDYPLAHMIGTPAAPHPQEVEIAKLLESKLAEAILQLPPYEVAKLNGDPLSPLNLSKRILMRTLNWQGTAEPLIIGSRRRGVGGTLLGAGGSGLRPAKTTGYSGSQPAAQQGRPTYGTSQPLQVRGHPQPSPARSSIPNGPPGSSGSGYMQGPASQGVRIPMYPQHDGTGLPMLHPINYITDRPQQYFQQQQPIRRGNGLAGEEANRGQHPETAQQAVIGHQRPTQPQYQRNAQERRLRVENQGAGEYHSMESEQKRQKLVDGRWSGQGGVQQHGDRPPPAVSPMTGLEGAAARWTANKAGGGATTTTTTTTGMTTTLGSTSTLGASGFHTYLTPEQQSEMMERQRAQLLAQQQQPAQPHPAVFSSSWSRPVTPAAVTPAAGTPAAAVAPAVMVAMGQVNKAAEDTSMADDGDDTAK